MKYIQHNSSVRAVPTPKQTRLQRLQARLDTARRLAKFGNGPNIHKVYDADDNLVEYREDTGWVDN